MDSTVRSPQGAHPGAAAADVQLAELALEDLLDDVLSRIRETLSVDTVAVLLLDDNGDWLVARAAKGLEEEVERGVRVPVGKGFAGRVAAGMRPIVLDDIDHADIVNPLLREKGLQALLGVPILVEEKLLGVLHVGSMTPREFTKDDIRLLELVAAQVALPMVQAQLYELEREAREGLERVGAQLTFLADASAALGSSLDYETTLASVARLAVPDLADWCVVDLVDPTGDIRRVAVVCADPAKQPLADDLLHGAPPPPDQQEGTWKVVRTGRAELASNLTGNWIDAVAVDPRQREILRSLGLTSNILVPLVARGRTLGVLTLATAESGRIYGESELRLAEELAVRAALAVDNARLYREAEDALGLLDTLFATAPVGLAFVDRQLRYLRVNDALAAINGVSPKRHIGRAVAEVIPHLAESVEPLMRHVLETCDPILDQEVTATAGDRGRPRTFLASYYPVRAGDGEAVGVGVVVTDLTERTEAAHRLAAQYEVTRILATADSLEEAAPQILRALGESLGWDGGHLWQVDDDRGRLTLLERWRREDLGTSGSGHDSSERQLDARQGLSGRVWESGQPCWVADLIEGADVSEPAGERAVRSRFAFPVLLGSIVLGVVEFFGSQPRDRDEELLEMAVALGSQIGQFIERHRAASETEAARERLAFLAEASRVLSSSLDFETTLERIAELAVPVLADWCAVELLEPDGTLRQVALTHVDPAKVAWAKQLAERYPADPDAPVGSYAVMRSGEPLLMTEIPDEMLVEAAQDDEHLRLLRDIGLTSWIAAPLIARGRPIGILSLLTTESRRVYAREDLEFAVELARRSAVAADNARLYQDAVRSEEQQRFLAEAGSALASSLDYQGTLQQVARLAVPAFADWCIVDVVDGEHIQRVAVAAQRADSQNALEELRKSYPPKRDSPQPAARALREGRPVLFYDFTAESLAQTTIDERHYELMRRLEPRSAVAVPLVARGHTVGAITFAWAESGRSYTDADLPLAEEIARRAALAVDNARLHRETEERAQAALVLSRVGDGVFMVDQDGIVRLWNPAAEAITGLSADSVVGQPADSVIPAWQELAERVPVADSPAPAARRAGTLPLEVEGRELWLSITGVGLEEGTVYAFRDLTEERGLEKMRSDFVSTISHELRTPLASVYGAAVTLLRREADLDAEQRARLVGVIASEAERLARIVNDILLANRLDSQTLVFTIESCDARDVVERAVAAASTHLPEGTELLLAEANGAPRVAADPDKLRQVLGNLIDNAIKYSPDGGRVELQVESRGALVRFRVTDEGIGIPASEQERIFEKFYRLDPELLRGVGGTGLGLYITRELVRRMEGRIWVESEFGRGSSFYVELPAAAGAASRPGNGTDG